MQPRSTEKESDEQKRKAIVQTEEGRLVGGPEGLLGGVHHVEEAVFIALLLVDLRDGSRHRHHAVTVDQEEEGLVGI